MEALQRKGRVAQERSVASDQQFPGAGGEVTRSKGTKPKLWSAEDFAWIFA